MDNPRKKTPKTRAKVATRADSVPRADDEEMPGAVDLSDCSDSEDSDDENCAAAVAASTSTSADNPSNKPPKTKVATSDNGDSDASDDDQIPDGVLDCDSSDSEDDSDDETCSASVESVANASTWTGDNPRRKPKQSWQKKRKLGRAKMKRDRLLQEIVGAAKNKSLTLHLRKQLRDVQKRLSSLQGAAVRRPKTQEVCCVMLYGQFMFLLIAMRMQVYAMLDDVFHDCPWPVPPSAILLHIPVQENKPKQTSEAILRDVLGRDRKWKSFGNWDIRDVAPRPDAT